MTVPRIAILPEKFNLQVHSDIGRGVFTWTVLCETTELDHGKVQVSFYVPCWLAGSVVVEQKETLKETAGELIKKLSVIITEERKQYLCSL